MDGGKYAKGAVSFSGHTRLFAPAQSQVDNDETKTVKKEEGMCVPVHREHCLALGLLASPPRVLRDPAGEARWVGERGDQNGTG